MHPVPVFWNVASGSAGLEAQLQDAASEADIAVDLHPVEPPELAAKVREAAAANEPVVGIAGGDGSVSTAAQILAGRGTALAVFPAGTLNHFARALGIGDHGVAARALAAGSVEGVDVGEVNGRVFVNGVSFGLYPEMLRLRERWEPRIGKWPAALFAAARAVAEFPHGPLWRGTGDAASQYPLVWVGAGRGSFRSPRLNPRELRSGVLELVIVSTHSRARILRLARTTLMRGLDGLAACADSPWCTVQEVTEFHPPDPLPSTVHAGLDGELVRLHPPLRFRVRPRALRVICTRETSGAAG